MECADCNQAARPPVVARAGWMYSRQLLLVGMQTIAFKFFALVGGAGAGQECAAIEKGERADSAEQADEGLGEAARASLAQFRPGFRREILHVAGWRRALVPRPHILLHRPFPSGRHYAS